MIASPPARRSATSENAAAAERVHAYARAVVAGDVVANRYVRLACGRHLDDLEHGEERGLRWDPEKAGRAIRFFGFLRLAEGSFAGKAFALIEWQAFAVGSLFGWYVFDADDGEWVRRFRNAYIETGKGSGKTPLAAGIGLYGMEGDDEAAAEVYSAAASRDQAGITWTDAKRMVEKSPTLSSRIGVGAHTLSDERRASSFRPVSSEAKNLHGKRPHIVLVDEEHAHPDSETIDAMRAGTKGRRNALIVRITNSGFDRHSVCWADHEYSISVLEGVLVDDAWFAFVCGLDMCDEHRRGGMPVDECPGCDQWTDESVWPKANPSIGVSITLRYLREMVTEAIGKPSQKSVVKRLNFCIWTEGSGKWLDVTAFLEGGGDRADIDDRRGPAGLDLSSTTDLTAFALKLRRSECPDEAHAGRPCYDLLSRFWVPEENVDVRTKRDHVPYDVWIRDGWITPTPGNRVDQERVVRDVTSLGASITELGIDRWNTAWLTPALQAEGIDVVEVGQGFAGLSAGSKRLEADIAEQIVHHDGNPVLAWMVANAVAEQDAAGNVKPSKAKSHERIDGVAAWVDALVAETQADVEEEFVSIYETRGLASVGAR